MEPSAYTYAYATLLVRMYAQAVTSMFVNKLQEFWHKTYTTTRTSELRNLRERIAFAIK